MFIFIASEVNAYVKFTVSRHLRVLRYMVVKKILNVVGNSELHLGLIFSIVNMKTSHGDSALNSS